MPKYIQLHELIAKLNRGTFIFESEVNKEHKNDLIVSLLQPFINCESDVSLTDQIMTYIN